MENILAQTDQLILQVVAALEGERETEIVRRLLRLRDSLTRHSIGQALDAQSQATRDEVIVMVNNFFYEKLTGLPKIKLYMDEFKE